jgi:hypothetical protein
MKNEMTRYSNLGNGRKDTLFTFREGDTVFFGISRCNVKAGDVFDKTKGRLIAQGRAFKAKELVDSGQVQKREVGNIEQEKQFVSYGSIPVVDVKNLLGYFRSLRESFKP